MIDNGVVEIQLNKVFKNTLNFFFLRLRLMAVFFSLLFFLTALFYFIQRKTYTIDYYISSDYISGQKIDLILTDIKQMVKESKYAFLSDMLKVPVADLKKIKSIKVDVESPEYMLSSNVNPSPGFYFNETNTQIQIYLNDSIDVKRLTNALNDYIAGSSYFQKIKKNEELVIEMVNDNLEKQKLVLDSINKINLSKFQNPSGNIIFANDISGIKSNIYAIEERLINNKRELARIQTPVNFVNYPTLNKYTLKESLLLGLLKSFILLTVLFAAGYFWKKIRAAYKLFRDAE